MKRAVDDKRIMAGLFLLALSEIAILDRYIL